MSLLPLITDYLPVTAHIHSSGQPTEAQLHALGAEGIACVINLGVDNARYSVCSEAAIMASAGIDYIHIPVDFNTPSLQDFRRFCKAMQTHRKKMLLVHCAANKRASCFTALWAESIGLWNRQQAEAHVGKIWTPNATWRRLINDIRDNF